MSGIDTVFLSYINLLDKSLPIKYFNDYFLSLASFPENTADIDGAIFGGSSLVLVFSPKGHIFLTKRVAPSGNLEDPKNYTPVVLKNPIASYDDSYYKNNFTNWYPVDYTGFVKYNSSIPFPQYFLSIPGDLGNGVVGSGFILYRDTAYSKSSSTGVYHILYNPFSRASSAANLPMNLKKHLFTDYCSRVEFQDAACYCTDDKNHRCIYAAAMSDTMGEAILDAKQQADSNDLGALSAFIGNCACNTVCKNWAGSKNLAIPPSCSESVSNVFCAGGLSAKTKSIIEIKGNVNLEQTCGINNKNSYQSSYQNSNTKTIIIIASVIVLLVVLVAVGFYFHKK
jgi:hypothetical protein